MVSVIIPVYNTGKILNKCLSSILAQTYKDWECIVVNDCSTDKKTLELLKEWKSRDERFVVLDNAKNLGIEKNRFVGLSVVKGDYVMFMDHDDWLYASDSLQLLVENAEATKADIVVAHHDEAYGPCHKAGYVPVPPGVITQPELKEKYYCSYFGVNLMPVLVWAKLYRRDLIDKADMKPHGLRYSDDVAWNLFIMPFAQTVSVIPQTVYVHRWGGLSSTASHALEEYKLFYRIRREAMVRFDFPEARQWLDIEMKNILFEHLRQQMVLGGVFIESVREMLARELDEPVWGEVNETLSAQLDDFSQALLDRDVDRMIAIVQRHVKSPKERLKQVVKQGLRWLT